MGHRNRKPKGKRLVVGLVLTAIFILFITCVAKLPTINVLLQEILSPGQSASTEYGWNLILVNQDYKVPKDWDIELTELSNGQSVDSRIYPDLQQMFDDMRAQGVYPVVASGYRTAEKQQELMDEKIDELTNHLKDEYNLNSDIFVVSQVVKQELTKNAIYSLILSAIGIAIYVSIRFKFNYAISSLVALMHDVAIVILFFGITNLEVSSILIAAILTIIGYSINATIVTFDMIRSNYSKFNGKKVTPEILREIVNNSVRQTLTRSILTTLTTIVPVLCLMLFGAYEILNFNIALFVGFIAGLYSSVFISNQLWLYLETKKLSKPAKPKKKIDEVEELQIKGINC